ncbi:hypothetical protein MKZ38_007451 [Zalerion maritima]|uniref:Uncharacterized protein n=1 Tax=Zalerion maritima TaxID=339359 RepID=A0AAD5RIS1_9PEZI|nr:hypothetical protein MKZ38_007451 [Zalerion maritima]
MKPKETWVQIRDNATICPPTYSDDHVWAYHVDGNGQSQYLFDKAGNFVPYAEVALSASASKSDSGKSDKSNGSKRSSSSKDSKHSGSSKKSKSSKSDSGLSSNTPATVGWECHWCQTVNYTDHQMIPFMDPLRDHNGNILRNEHGNVDFGEYPYIPCIGCDGRCNPYCTVLFDP